MLYQEGEPPFETKGLWNLLVFYGSHCFNHFKSSENRFANLPIARGTKKGGTTHKPLRQPSTVSQPVHLMDTRSQDHDNPSCPTPSQEGPSIKKLLPVPKSPMVRSATFAGRLANRLREDKSKQFLKPLQIKRSGWLGFSWGIPSARFLGDVLLRGFLV